MKPLQVFVGAIALLGAAQVSIPCHGKVALVGPSGGGKTTIFSLIQRFYDVIGGEILVNGANVRSLSAHAIRRQIAFVSQDTYLFSGSVRENIRIGRLDATDAEVERAAADADEFIRVLPRGYETDVGENGVRLSQSPGRSSRGRRSCCLTRRPRRSTRSRSEWSSGRSMR